jgi:hypothetical protein
MALMEECEDAILRPPHPSWGGGTARSVGGGAFGGIYTSEKYYLCTLEIYGGPAHHSLRSWSPLPMKDGEGEKVLCHA